MIIKKSNHVLIRQATINDIQKVMEIEHLCFDEDTWEDETVYLQRINTFPEGFLLLEKENEIIGAISSEIWIRSEKINPSLFTLGHDISQKHHYDGNELYVSSIAVVPKQRRLGYGELLFQTLLLAIDHKYPHVSSIILLVAENWTAAQAIYRKNGFQEVTIFPRFFGGIKCPTYDGIVMRKEKNLKE